MKKKINYWNAIFTHILTAGFMFFVLNIIGGFSMIFVLKAAIGSSLLPLIAMISSIVVIDGSIALAAYLSMRYMKKYEIDELNNFVNFSSIVAAVLLIMWMGTSLVILAISAVGILIFYRITKKMSLSHPVAQPATM